MQPNDTPAPTTPRPLDVDVRPEARLGTFLQEDRIDTTDEAWQRGMTPMNVLRRDEDEDTSDAPTVIAGGPEELPDLSDLFPFPLVRKKAAPVDEVQSSPAEAASPESEEAAASEGEPAPEEQADASSPEPAVEELGVSAESTAAAAQPDAAEVVPPEEPQGPREEAPAEVVASAAPAGPAQAGPPVALIFGAGLGVGLLLAGLAGAAFLLAGG